MLRTMRSNAKWIFYILAIAFVAWLGIGQVMSILGPSGNVVLRVNGREFQVTEYQQRVQLASEQYRQQNGTAPLTREEDQQIQNQVINQMIQDALLEQEYNRLGIRVSAEEIIDMAHNSPPPEVMRDPQFQTDSQFDIRKWQQFLATTSDRNLLAQIELTVGLELRIAHHLGRRRVVRHVDDFFGTDANAEAVVLLLEQRVLNHLTDHLILDLLVFLARQRCRAVLLPILVGRDLHAPLILVDLEFSAVDAEHDVAARAEDAHHLTEGEPQHEGDGEDVKDPLGVGAHRAQHGDVGLRLREG